MLQQYLLKARMNGICQRSIITTLKPMTGVFSPMILHRKASTNMSFSSNKSKLPNDIKKRVEHRFVNVDSPFSKANKKIYLMPSDPYFASEKVKKILKLGSLDDAVDYVKALPSYLQTVVLWNQLFKYCADHGKANMAEKYFVQMRKRGIAPNEYTFAHMFTSFEKSTSPVAVSRAESWFEKMKKYDIKPSIFHINILMRVYNSANRPEMVIDILKMLTSANRHDDIIPDVVTFSTALQSCSKLENLSQASTEIQNIWQIIKCRTSRNTSEHSESSSSPHSLLAEKASKIKLNENTLRNQNQSPLKLDDELIMSLLNAVAKTAVEEQGDILIAIEAINYLYSLYPVSAAEMMNMYDHKNKEHIYGFGYQPSIKVLDAILRFTGKVKKFQLGRDYFRLALHQYPQLKPDEFLYETASWLSKQIKTKQVHKKKKTFNLKNERN
ncbi:uncharacterized protein BX663DRAFT_500008 [Cokeromyces recurvatus]|uniref:uncharacterized protein n=1 Tax=Cokeromyces recurvatus TaxID=90255 RepID=UPI00221F86E7|nr:uncharacterized protein BX663DRAFT_500008 [Cokeromyces recurvatus]KAI7905513.1 hypothetical protein BX663DRAFT_500008 [Cokeromyces recurvatus]